MNIRALILTSVISLPAIGTVACSSEVAPQEGDDVTGDDAEIKAGMACRFGTKKVKVGERVPDSDGCNTCTCNKNGKQLFMACTELACAPKACAPVACALFCRDGFKKDANGCATCSCVQRSCAPVVCQLFCKNGFKTGADGCATCSCAP